MLWFMEGEVESLFGATFAIFIIFAISVAEGAGEAPRLRFVLRFVLGLRFGELVLRRVFEGVRCWIWKVWVDSWGT